MRIHCPQCQSQYNVDEKRIPPQGVQIKCPKCLHSFVVQPPSVEDQAGAVPLPGGQGAVPLPGGQGAVPLPGGQGAVPLPGGQGAVPLPGMAGGGAVPLPGMAGGGAVPLPGMAGGGAVPLPGMAGGGAVPLPGMAGGGAVPLPGMAGGGAVPLPGMAGGGAVPLPGMGGAPGAFPPAGGGFPPPDFGAGGGFPPPDFGGGNAFPPPPGPPPSAFAPRNFAAEVALGTATGGARNENSVVAPFHGATQARAVNAAAAPAPATKSMDAGVLDFIDREAADMPAASTRKGPLTVSIRKRSGKVQGPLTEQQVLIMLRKQELMGSEDASDDGVTWKPLSQFPSFADEIQALMASALGALGDLPAPVAPGGRSPASAPTPSVPDPFANLEAAFPGGAPAAEPAASPEQAAATAKEAKQAKKRTEAKPAKKEGSGFPFGLVFGVAFLLLLVGGAIVTEFFTPYGALGIRHFLAKMEHKPVAPVDNKPVVQQPVAEWQPNASVDTLLAEDNFGGYEQVQKKLAGEVAGGSGGAAQTLALAFALPAFLDAKPALADEARAALKLSTGKGAAKLLGAVTVFAHLAKNELDEAQKAATETAGTALPDVKTLDDQARQAESWAQAALGYVILARAGKPDDAMQRFDWALTAWTDNIVATVGQARALMAANDLDSAQGYLERAVAMQKENIRARLLLADLLVMKKNKSKEAKGYLEPLVGSTGAKGTARQRADAHVLLSEVAARSRDFKEASDQLRKAVAQIPDDIGLKVRSGELLLRLREWPQARAIFDDVLNGQPDYEPAIIGSARAKMGATDALNAYKQLQDATAKKPQSALLRYWFGQAAEALGKGDEALKSYKTSENLDPKRAAPVVARAVIGMRARKYAETLSDVQAARGRVAPEEEPVLRSVLAQVYVKQRNHALAFKEFEASLQADPRNSETRALYGAALREVGRFDDAKKNLEQAHDEDPKNAMILAEVGSYHMSQGHYEKAIDFFQQAIGVAPKEADFYVRLGAATYSKGDHSGAVEFLKQAQSLAPTNPDVFYWMALAVRKTDPEKSKSLLKQGMDIVPDDGRFDHEMGRSMFGEGNMIEAIEFLRSAIRKMPSNGDAYFELGRCLMEQAKYADARDQLQRAVDLMPGRASIRTYIAETYAKTGDYAQAAAQYKKALAQDSNLPEAHCLLAEVYRNDNKLKPAIQHYEKCVQLQPTHREAWKWLANCYKDLGGKANARKAIDAFQKHLKASPADPDNDMIRDQLAEMR